MYRHVVCTVLLDRCLRPGSSGQVYGVRGMCERGVRFALSNHWLLIGQPVMTCTCTQAHDLYGITLRVLASVVSPEWMSYVHHVCVVYACKINSVCSVINNSRNEPTLGSIHWC